MFQIDNSTAATQLPTISNPGTPGFFTDGNPATGQAPTIVPAEWFNTVMMELCNAVIASGQTLTKGKLNQLALAIQSQGAPFAIDTGTANTYLVNFTPAFTARTEGQVIRFKAKTANTGASTLNDGIGAVPLVGGAHSALQAGEIAANGDCWAQWNSSVGGSGSYILLFCTGAPMQVANATQSKHAVNLGQADGRYATIVNPAFNGPIAAQITEGSTPAYNMLAQLSGSGIASYSIGGGYRFYYKSGIGSTTKAGESLAIRSYDLNTGESGNLMTIDGAGNVATSGSITATISEGSSSAYNLVAQFGGGGIYTVSNGGGYRLYYQSGNGSSTKAGESLAIRSYDSSTGESGNLFTIDGAGNVAIATSLTVPAGSQPTNPVVNSQIVTSSSDPSGSNNTASPASTNWIRNSMSAIATAAGFSASFGTNGYLKFPSWLGSFVIQWGSASISTTPTNYNLPTAFPNSCFSAVGVTTVVSNQFAMAPISRTQFSAVSSIGALGIYYIAVGN